MSACQRRRKPRKTQASKDMRQKRSRNGRKRRRLHHAVGRVQSAARRSNTIPDVVRPGFDDLMTETLAPQKRSATSSWHSGFALQHGAAWVNTVVVECDAAGCGVKLGNQAGASHKGAVNVSEFLLLSLSPMPFPFPLGSKPF